ncbi:hypothetical protein J3R30DRAFT_3659341 [Lentinula aciculospora]|uniref:2,4-dienoyl-CoA reductase [(3E)-enoyl-CoA-producing] n=1 Tax=Lentinula aciculospora TaxID=153920 RepID=A0A9W9A336_9AGAR|nr:hypothetical protein J3R30DRAFT_3659341 [Lentinula aciculospora]
MDSDSIRAFSKTENNSVTFPAKFPLLSVSLTDGSFPVLCSGYNSTSTIKDNIFQGKVLFCTGGGSGLCKGMTEAIEVRLVSCPRPWTFLYMFFVICGAAGNFIPPIAGLSENAFETVIEIHTLGTYNTVKATISHIRKTKGAYIHVSATLHYRGTPYQIHVSTAKAGVDAISNVVAVEEDPHGVRSNVIAPGFTSGTEGMRVMSGNKTNKAEGFSNPLGPFIEIPDVANAAVFLFSPAACYITGQVIPIDGGAEHLRGNFFPYPSPVLDPSSISKLFKGKM